MQFKITFKHGLQNPVVIEANDIETARKLGLAHHRKNTGFVETVDKWPIEFVVDEVIPLI